MFENRRSALYILSGSLLILYVEFPFSMLLPDNRNWVDVVLFCNCCEVHINLQPLITKNIVLAFFNTPFFSLLLLAYNTSCGKVKRITKIFESYLVSYNIIIQFVLRKLELKLYRDDSGHRGNQSSKGRKNFLRQMWPNVILWRKDGMASI